MAWSRFDCPFRGHARQLTALFSILISVTVVPPVLAQNQAPIGGRNVNVVSGREWPDGDPFLQRQNEPSLAISTRNPQHLLAGSNDYRTVDINTLPRDSRGNPNGRVVGDAWAGLYKSLDGGNTWISTLLPGYPQDKTVIGSSSPLKTFFSDLSAPGGTTIKTYAAADPIVRAGTHGLFYYAGIVFDRTEGGRSALYVARFIDNNNLEKGDPIQYLGAALPDSRKSTDRNPTAEFIDKPGLATDIPRDGAKLCHIDPPAGTARSGRSQLFQAGNVYVSYTVFATPNEDLPSKIMLVRSTDCGANWDTPVQVSESGRVSQGSTISIDPNTGDVYVAWRQFNTAGSPNPNAIFLAKSTNGGKSFTPPVKAADVVPLDQGTGGVSRGTGYRSFRVNSYPTMAIDGQGRVYIAWSQRGVGPAGEARIVMKASTTGIWTGEARAIDITAPLSTATGTRHQIMPSLAFAAGKLTLIYYDARDTFIPVNWHPPYIADELYPAPVPWTPPPPFWQTIDVRAAQADAGGNPVFLSTKLSKYLYLQIKDQSGAPVPLQLQFNAPNYPLFAAGTVPFIGDYIEVAGGPAFLPVENGRWTFNTGRSNSTVFHSLWADNRDVVPPRFDGSNFDWTKYNAPDYRGGVPGKHIFDDSDNTSATCLDTSGMRNQNIYAATISNGLVVVAPGNNKPIGKGQRSFVISVRNETSQSKTFRISIQSPAKADVSFLQFEMQPVVDVPIPAHSSIARTLYVSGKMKKRDVISVDVSEISGTGGTILPTGLSGSVALNADESNPDLLDPNILNAPLDLETHNPNILNTVQIVSLTNPNILNPNILNADLINADLVNPNILNPNILNPNILNPDLLDPNILNPNILNPNILNPNILNPNILNPDPTTPNILNPNLEVKDVVWTVENAGNTTSAYTFNTLFKKVPPGLKFQLLIYKQHSTPTTTITGCNVVDQPHQELLVNIIDPNILNPNILNPNILNPNILNPDIRNASFSLGPDERAQIALRILDLDRRDQNKLTIPVSSPDPTVPDVQTAFTDQVFFQQEVRGPNGEVQVETTPVVTSSASLAVNTVDADAGITQPPIATSILTITSGNLSAGQVQEPYLAQLTADGGNGAFTWSITSGSLPAGLTLNTVTGVISGTPSSAGTFNFIATVRDSGSSEQPQQTATAQLTIVITAATGNATLAFVSQPAKTRAGEVIYPAVTVQAFKANGSPAPDVLITMTLALNPSSANLGGTTTAITGAAGLATFSTLTVNQGGIGFRLLASATGFVSSTSDLFDVLAPPTLGSINPLSGAQGATVPMTLTGTNFIPGATVVTLSGTGALVTAVNALNSNTLNATLVLSGSTGTRDLRVMTEAGISNTVSLTINPNSISNAGHFAASHLVGSLGGPGSADGAGTAARLGPTGAVYLWSDGTNLYIADPGSKTIRKMSIATGILTTLAGQAGSVGSWLDGTGAGARFTTPLGVWGDGTYLYVTDTWGIRKVAIATGTVTSLAGLAGFPGSADGTGSAARFSNPTGIWGDGTNLYVTEGAVHTVRKIVISTGEVTTFAGAASVIGSTDAVGTSARFNNPLGIWGDGTYLYVSDAGNTIRRITIATREVTTIAGTSGTPGTADGIGTLAQFRAPSGIWGDGTKLYITDLGNDTIRVLVLATGAVSTLAGVPGPRGAVDGTGPAAQFFAPAGIWGVGGNLYVTDQGNRTLRKVVIATAEVTTAAGLPAARGSSDGTGSSAKFRVPTDVWSDGTNMYVSDTGNHTIRKIVIATGVVTTLAGQPGTAGSSDGTGSAAQFSSPERIWGDGSNLFVVDRANHTIRKIVIATGAVTTLAGAPGLTGFADGIGSAARFNTPKGIWSDGANLYVTDAGNHTIRKIQITTGAVTTFAGSPGLMGSSDGIGSAARFNDPRGIWGDAALLYVVDAGNRTIRRVLLANAATSTMAGTPGISGYADGIGASAQFNVPDGIWGDGPNVYVADSSNHLVRKIVTSTNTVTTLAGSLRIPATAGRPGSEDGIDNTVGFVNPRGLWSDGSDLYVVDSGNSAIRKLSPIVLPAPTLSSITPSTALRGSTLSVVLLGNNYVSEGTSVIVDEGDIAVSSIRVTGPGSLNVTFAIPIGLTVGDRHIRISTSAGTTSAVTFTVSASIITHESTGSIALNFGPDPLGLAGRQFVLTASVDSNATSVPFNCCATDFQTIQTVLIIVSGIHAGTYQSTGPHYIRLIRDTIQNTDRMIMAGSFTINGSTLNVATWHTYPIGAFGNPSTSVFELPPPYLLPGAGDTSFSNMFDQTSTTSYNLQSVNLDVQ